VDNRKTENISQTEAGHAFEYTVLRKLLHKIFDADLDVEINEDSEVKKIKESYLLVKKKQKRKIELYDGVAEKFVEFLMKKEEKISKGQDKIILSKQSDAKGQKGDVRDILIKKGYWEIGISCKWNNESIRSPRLSDQNDFGKRWIGTPCSDSYLTKMKKIFENTRKSKKKWNEIDEKIKIKKYYKPTHEAFITEFKALQKKDKKVVKNFVKFIVGTEDYYKLIGRSTDSTVALFNFNKTLNEKKTVLPTKMLNAQLVETKKLQKNGITFSMSFDKGWQFHFRLHSADSKLSPSLKLETTIEGYPKTLKNYPL